MESSTSVRSLSDELGDCESGSLRGCDFFREGEHLLASALLIPPLVAPDMDLRLRARGVSLSLWLAACSAFFRLLSLFALRFFLASIKRSFWIWFRSCQVFRPILLFLASHTSRSFVPSKPLSGSQVDLSH